MGQRYTEAELNARMRFSIGILLAVCLVGIVFVVLYSLIFVTQPIGQQSPNDAEFFKLITPIATFLTGILSGIMLGKTDNRDEKKDGPEQPELGPAKEPLELMDEADDHIA
jgi:hypothetical protein